MLLAGARNPRDSPSVIDCLTDRARVGDLQKQGVRMADRLRWGVLGASSIARTAIVPAMQASRNGRVVALASRNPAKGQDFASAFGIDRVTGYDELLADPEVDAVYIPLPNSMHAEWIMRAASAGKPVLCDKPIALDAKEAAAVVDACAELGAPLMEGFMYRFHPQHRRVHELIAQGTIGDVQEVRVHLSVDITNPADPGNIRFAPKLGGGTLLDMGCYCISICRMIFGEEPRNVRGWWHIDKHFGVDTAAAGVLEFADGKVGVMSCSFTGNGQGFYTVVGRNGCIEVPRGIILGLGSRVPEALVVVVDAGGRRREETFPAVDQYQLMVESFADAVLSGQEPLLSPQDSVRNMAAVDAFARSARQGTPQTIRV